MDAKALLRKIYALHLSDGWERVPVAEQYLDIDRPESLSVDDHRNRDALYRELAERYPEALSDAVQTLVAASEQSARTRPFKWWPGSDRLRECVPPDRD